jgi:hypothetical protein
MFTGVDGLNTYLTLWRLSICTYRDHYNTSEEILSIFLLSKWERQKPAQKTAVGVILTERPSLMKSHGRNLQRKQCSSVTRWIKTKTNIFHASLKLVEHILNHQNEGSSALLTKMITLYSLGLRFPPTLLFQPPG